jgi:cytidylate kinase
MNSVPVITIDGPGGAGKGTVSHAIARELGWHFLDSGAVYRLLALAALKRGMDLNDLAGLTALAGTLAVVFPVDGGDAVLLDGEDVGREIRTEAVGNAASQVAALAEVRASLLDRQRAFRRTPGLVADGRDMGTVVFADAPVKIFLTASIEERARRRYKQLKAKGIDATLPAIKKEIAERDRRDAKRATAPMRPAEDATVIDTSQLDIPSSIARVREIIRAAHLV